MEGRQLVAWNLRRLRVLRSLSQEALAADAEVDRSYVGRLERAEENPTVGAWIGLRQSLRFMSPSCYANQRLASNRRSR
ncbi:helix-turn-helix domain-containing protein [Bradyrhizobium japonicum]|uniref:helix-turn-helix domain-containing protein n=1 Tax=Bradyrhizobium japonicum TaxID=375 RepID=UPI0035D9D4A8